VYSIFETEITIRPDDIDLNNHVHNAKYLDFIQAARYIQMRDCYNMPMEDFHALGYNWFASVAHIEYKRALRLGDQIVVRTQVKDVNGAQVVVSFWIVKKEHGKIAAEGYMTYTMISTKSGRPARIPEEIINHYSV
jgi:acyl-CoA thioester hydrolase/thioesterase-3